MLEMLKILCILLKVLMITRAIIAISSTEQENHTVQDTSSFELMNIDDYVSSIEYVQNYSERVIVRNEIDILLKALEEDTTSSENIPSEPTFPRAFVDFENKLIEKDIFVTFRWNKPKFTNKVIQKYRVQYWFENENLNETIQRSVDIIPNTILQHKVYNLSRDTIYYFRVQAHNEFGAGPYTKFINVSTIQENPIPFLLFKRDIHDINVLDIDLHICIELTTYLKKMGYYEYTEIVYSALEHKIYAINWFSLETWDFNPNAIETNRNVTKIAQYDYFPMNLCIDWIYRNLYWIQYGETEIYIVKLDLTLWQQMGIVKYDKIQIDEETSLTFLKILPYKRYFYWSKKIDDERKSSAWQLDFNGKNKKHLFEDYKCSCQYEQLNQLKFMQIDTTNVDKPLIYWISQKQLITTDINGCNCNLILNVEMKFRINFNYLVIDKIHIYLYNEFESIMYIFKKNVLLENKENAFEHVKKINMQQASSNLHYSFIALDKSLETYPPTKCLTPNMKDYRVGEVLTTTNSINVSLPEPILNDGCEKYNLSTTIYHISVSYFKCTANGSKFEQLNVQTYERHYEFRKLMPFTKYTLKLALTNFYVHKLSNLKFGTDVELATKGKLDAPRDVTVEVLTPVLAMVSWISPKKLKCISLTYEVHWMQYSNNMPQIIQKLPSIKPVDKLERTRDGKLFTTLHLKEKHKYRIYVRVCSKIFTKLFNDSLSKTVYMSEPNNINLSGVSTNSMNISWISSVNLTRYTKFHPILEYKNEAMQEWQIANNFERNNSIIIYYIKNLLLRTRYKFRLIWKYPKDQIFIFSPNEGFTFETLGDATKVPSAPGTPIVTKFPNFTYHLKWKPAESHDSQTILYRLEGLIVENNYKEGNQTDKNDHWNLYYNGTDTYWITTRDMNKKYRFRVQAENAYGFGEWSESSADVDLTESIEISTVQHLYKYLSLLSLVAVIAICYVYYSYRQRKKNNQIIPPSIIDTGSTTISDTSSVNSESRYDPKPQSDQDEFAGIIIDKDQINFVKLLGRGYFGEVYQGTVKDFKGSEITPVAIKMLPDGATSQEKDEFLKEPKLMRDFDDKHVLKLLGVCFEAESPLLILELMETDLLTYLREKRILEPEDPHALRLQDLIAMCEDIAQGCRYLEEQHFVHRDLACRNCLISTRDREHPIIKVSDFGLARDIYENDYYSMEGETPLPVRWMAPESLESKIFTSQSDVWSFGIVMWEITSLGQQPHAAIDNCEIVNHVCARKKLSKPRNCPDKLYQLMLSCWNEVKERPKFKICVKYIKILKVEIPDEMLIPWDISKRVQLPPSGISEYLQMADLGIDSVTFSKVKM